MDVLLRLRVLIWVLVLGLWGIMVYQYLGEEDADTQQQMRYVSNPYKDIPPPPVPQELPAPPVAPANASPGRGQDGSAPNAPVMNAPQVALAGPPAPPPSSLDFIKPLPVRPRAHARRVARPRPPPREDHSLRFAKEPPIPAGFVKTLTPHFLIYSEGSPPSDQFIRLAENLHGNLMLDLAAFSPWAQQQRVTIFLFRTQDAYRRMTGRPAWSGGASSVSNRRLYLYESDELQGILAHELTHIYYDGFYLGGSPDPLWLSEGMATLVQVERGLAAPNWLRENLEIVENGGGYSLQDLMSVTSTADAPDDKVRLWYAESYSVVRFLIRSQYKSSFYKFSVYLRDGSSVTEALYRAYGMPFNRVKALEYAWRYDLTSSQMGRLSAADR